MLGIGQGLLGGRDATALAQNFLHHRQIVEGGHAPPAHDGAALVIQFPEVEQVGNVLRLCTANAAGNLRYSEVLLHDYHSSCWRRSSSLTAHKKKGWKWVGNGVGRAHLSRVGPRMCLRRKKM